MLPAVYKTAKVKLTELNPHLICVLCGGYYIDATTIIECLHTFCKTCIVRYLETSKYCPVCDVMVHKTKPLLHIRQDHVIQALVYKMVPGLFSREMLKRRDFFEKNLPPGDKLPDEDSLEQALLGSSSQITDVLDDYSLNGAEKEKVSVSLQFSPNGRPIDEYEFNYNSDEENDQNEITQTRYLLCPAAFSVSHLKKFVKMKFDLDDSYTIEVFHIDEPLCDKYTLMDIAYIYAWRRLGPLRLYYSVYQNPAKRRKHSHPESVPAPADITTQSEPTASTSHQSPPALPPPEAPTPVAQTHESNKASLKDEASGETKHKSKKSHSKDRSHKHKKDKKDKSRDRQKKKKKSSRKDKSHSSSKSSKHKSHKSSRKRKETEQICDSPPKCAKLGSEETAHAPNVCSEEKKKPKMDTKAGKLVKELEFEDKQKSIKQGKDSINVIVSDGKPVDNSNDSKSDKCTIPKSVEKSSHKSKSSGQKSKSSKSKSKKDKKSKKLQKSSSQKEVKEERQPILLKLHKERLQMTMGPGETLEREITKIFDGTKRSDTFQAIDANKTSEKPKFQIKPQPSTAPQAKGPTIDKDEGNLAKRASPSSTTMSNDKDDIGNKLEQTEGLTSDGNACSPVDQKTSTKVSNSGSSGEESKDSCAKASSPAQQKGADLKENVKVNVNKKEKISPKQSNQQQSVSKSQSTSVPLEKNKDVQQQDKDNPNEEIMPVSAQTSNHQASPISDKVDMQQSDGPDESFILPVSKTTPESGNHIVSITPVRKVKTSDFQQAFMKHLDEAYPRSVDESRGCDGTVEKTAKLESHDASQKEESSSQKSEVISEGHSSVLSANKAEDMSMKTGSQNGEKVPSLEFPPQSSKMGNDSVCLQTVKEIQAKASGVTKKLESVSHTQIKPFVSTNSNGNNNNYSAKQTVASKPQSTGTKKKKVPTATLR